MSYNQGGAPNNISAITFGTFGTVFYTPLTSYSGIHFDGVGYNPVDNYLYGVEVNTNQIVRLKSDGSAERIGSVDQVEVLNSSAGDCTADGRYLLYDNELDELMIFDVREEFRMLDRVQLYWKGTSELFTARLDDLAVDPNQPNTAYSFQGDYFDPDLDPFDRRGYILSIAIDPADPNFGMVSPIAKVPVDIIRQLGSLFFTNGGQLFGYGARSQGPNLRQGTLVAIDTRSGQTDFYDQTGPTGTITDGCSCPYSLTFENDAEPRGLLCSDVKTTYTLTITNRFFQDINGVSLRDTFPEGMIIEDVSGKYSGRIMAGSGVGTRFLNIDDLVIPSRSAFTIDIKLRIEDLGLQFNGNQAHLKNLPERYGNSMISDDPQTPDFIGDVTDIWIVAQDLEDFTMEIDPPSECIRADDAEVYISSPTLASGLQYEVKLRDREFNVSSRNVIIDEQRGFRLDSLLPGSYELFELNTAASECSFALNDTTINIIPPNEQVTASATTNAPLCELQNLSLSAEMSPAGAISWSGPFSFRSDEEHTTVPSVISAQSGIYEMTATYGYCEQVRSLEVEISEGINASIQGKDAYCARDEILLLAEGKGENILFDWQLPSKMNKVIDQNGEVLIIPTAEHTDEGSYSVILDNGICTDTANITIDVMSAPRVTLPSFLETDFCDPLTLQPNITSDEDVQYSWSPAGSLSCDDCPNPQVVFPILPSYQLLVTSQNACSDSTEVAVSLSTEKLLYAPNVFSPNLASSNHDFRMTAGCGIHTVLKMTIHNRWGKTVYSVGPFDPSDNSAYWDGLINGSIGDSGVYIWYAELELEDGQIVEMYGDVTLIP